jgi:hypothetical protein
LRVTTEEKTCPDCGQAFPDTAEFFNPGHGKRGKYLSRRCRPCESQRLWDSKRDGVWSSMNARDKFDSYSGDRWGD